MGVELFLGGLGDQNMEKTDRVQYAIDLLRTFFCPGWISFLSKQLALLARSFILEMATLGENLRCNRRNIRCILKDGVQLSQTRLAIIHNLEHPFRSSRGQKKLKPNR